MPTAPVVAILVSDIHLSDQPPAARAGEPDWFAAMGRPLQELKNLSRQHKCPILCGGDVFDHWKPSPRLLEFALRTLSMMYAVPGQHDLPNHQYDRMHESGYGVLCAAELIQNIYAEATLRTVKVGNKWLYLYGYPWGTRPRPVSKGRKRDGILHIAVCHSFIWVAGSAYTGGDIGCNHANAYAQNLRGYDVALFGDNHKGFHSGKIVNPGSFMRRRRDDGPPTVYLLHADAHVTPHPLNTSADVLAPIDVAAAQQLPQTLQNELRAFVEELATHGDVFDFRAAVRRYAAEAQLSDNAKKLLLNAVGL